MQQPRQLDASHYSQSSSQFHAAHGMQVDFKILSFKCHSCAIGPVGPVCGQQQSASMNIQQPRQSDSSNLVNSHQQCVSYDFTNGN